MKRRPMFSRFIFFFFWVAAASSDTANLLSLSILHRSQRRGWIASGFRE
jgi:hypothetical protein